MVRRATLGLVAFSLALAGCGDDAGDETKERTPDAPTQGAAPAPKPEPNRAGGWTGLKANTYEVGRDICGEGSRRALAAELGLPASADPFGIAEEYAKLSTDDHHQPSFEGCLAGMGVGD